VLGRGLGGGKGLLDGLFGAGVSIMGDSWPVMLHRLAHLTSRTNRCLGGEVIHPRGPAWADHMDGAFFDTVSS
jgi:hypothetical protein